MTPAPRDAGLWRVAHPGLRAVALADGVQVAVDYLRPTAGRDHVYRVAVSSGNGQVVAEVVAPDLLEACRSAPPHIDQAIGSLRAEVRALFGEGRAIARREGGDA